MGNFSPVNPTVGRLTDSKRKFGWGRPSRGIVSIGIPRCCACQAARVMLPVFSLPSEMRTSLGTIPEGNEAMASPMAASRSVALPVSPAVFFNCHPFFSSSGAGFRTDLAKGRTRVQ